MVEVVVPPLPLTLVAIDPLEPAVAWERERVALEPVGLGSEPEGEGPGALQLEPEERLEATVAGSALVVVLALVAVSAPVAASEPVALLALVAVSAPVAALEPAERSAGTVAWSLELAEPPGLVAHPWSRTRAVHSTLAQPVVAVPAARVHRLEPPVRAAGRPALVPLALAS